MRRVSSLGSGGKVTRKSHVIPAFYLRSFADQDEKVWSFDKKTRKIFPSAPKSVATVRDYYRGEQAIHEDDLEAKLASIESDAAPHLKSLIEGGAGDLPPEVARFLAWTMARTEWVRRLAGHFKFRGYLAENFEELCTIDAGSVGRSLPLSFRSVSGDVVHVPLERSREYLESSDWNFEVSQDMFLDMIRIQAYCFQTMHFPRLEWVTVKTPAGQRFVTSDRPASWDVLSSGWQDFPAALKHPLVDLIFPVSPHVALMAGHDRTSMLHSSITPRELNNRIASRADRYLYAQEPADLEVFANVN